MADVAVRSGGLRPVEANVSVTQAQPDTATPSALAQLSAIIDPAGTGPMAQLLKRQQDAALAETASAFERNADVTEMQIIQANPFLRGASTVIHKHLDHLRGVQAGREAVQQAEIEFAKTGLYGQDPGTVAKTYTEFRDAAREKVSTRLGKDGLSAFDATFSERQRQIEDKSVVEHIAEVDQKQIDEFGKTIQGSLETHSLDDNYRAFARDAMDHAFNAEAFGLTRKEAEATILQETIAFTEQNVTEGGAAFRAVLDQEGLITDPAMKARFAAAANSADSARLSEESAAYKKVKLEQQQQLDAAMGQIGTMIGNDAKPDTIAKARGLINQLPEEVRFKASKMLSEAITASANINEHLVSDEAINRYQTAAYLGQLTIDQLGPLQLTQKQYTALANTIDRYKRGHGIMGDSAVQSARKGIERIAFDADMNPDGKLIIGHAVQDFNQQMIDLAAADPTLLTDPSKSATVAGQVADALTKRLKVELDAPSEVAPIRTPDQVKSAVESINDELKAMKLSAQKLRWDAAADVVKTGAVGAPEEALVDAYFLPHPAEVEPAEFKATLARSIPENAPENKVAIPLPTDAGNISLNPSATTPNPVPSLIGPPTPSPQEKAKQADVNAAAQTRDRGVLTAISELVKPIMPTPEELAAQKKQADEAMARERARREAFGLPH